MKKLRENKIFKVIKTLVNVSIAVVLISFFVVVCLQRFSGNKLAIFNFRMFTVASGSMQPKYVVGDVLLSKQIDTKKIKVGDTISYLGTSGDFRDKVITHEVIAIDNLDNGKRVFHTKGIANIIEDPVVNEEQVYGVVIGKAKLLSWIYKMMSTKYGIFIIVIPLLYIFGSEFLSFLLEKEEKKRNIVK